MSFSSKATEPAGRSSGWLVLLATMTGLGPVSIDLYLPAFSAIERELGRGVENTLAAYLFGVALGQLVYGPVSDRYGRKPPLYVALILYSLGSIACAFAGGMPQLVMWRFVQALGGCAGIVIARAIVRDRCEPREAARVFSTLMLITAIAPVLAPACGGWLVRVASWRGAFWVQGAIGVLVLGAVHFVLEETHSARRTQTLRLQNVLGDYLSLLKDRQFMGMALIGSFSIGIIFCYVSGAPTVLTGTYGLTAQQFGWLMGLNGVSFVFASQLNVRRLRRHSPAAILRIAVWAPLLLGVGILATLSWFAVSLPVTIALLLSMFIAIGHIAPNIAAEALAHRGENAGTASALLGSLQSVGSTLAGAAMGAMNNGTVARIALLMAIGGALMLLMHLSLVAPRRTSG